jgi:hypothetical protein
MVAIHTSNIRTLYLITPRKETMKRVSENLLQSELSFTKIKVSGSSALPSVALLCGLRFRDFPLPLICYYDSPKLLSSFLTNFMPQKTSTNSKSMGGRKR